MSDKPLPFDAMEQGIDIDTADENDQRTVITGLGFLVSGDTFRRLPASCDGDFSAAAVIRYHNGKRQTWKVHFERPHDELIAGEYYRFNTVYIREEPA
jgi:hypothetical protein